MVQASIAFFAALLPLPPLPEAQFIQLLGSLHPMFKAGRSGLSMTLPNGALSVGLAQTYRNGKDPYVTGCYYTLSYYPDRYISAKRLVDGTRWWPERFGKISVALDGKVTHTLGVPIERGTNVRSLRTRMSDYLVGEWNLSAIFPGEGHRNEPYRIDESQRIDSLLRDDIESLAHQWKWPTPGFGFSGPVVPVICQIDGIEVVLSNGYNGNELLDKLLVRCEARDGRGRKLNELSDVLSTKLKPILVADYGTSLSFTLEIDLARGVRVSDIKRSILKFVEKVRPYVKAGFLT